VSFDPFLYVALAGGFAAGRATRWRSLWVGRAALVTVGVLLVLLGDSLGALPGATVASEIPIAILFALATLGATLLAVRLLARQETERPAVVPDTPLGRVLLTPLGLLAAVLIGVGVGHIGGTGAAIDTEYALYVLLALVGFDLEIDAARIRSAWIPLVAAATGGIAVAAAFAVTGLLPGRAAFATLAFGWYSLAGPLTAVRLGPALGLFAFLANFLRENLTMLSAPIVGKRVRGEGLAAMGGATSMDTTLYFVTRYGDPKAATVALATGIVLTTVAGLLVPVVLGLP
jgi:uncharacterized membrane protein YbjE (DUF340 family)